MQKLTIFFDVDDTLTTSNSWEQLNTKAGISSDIDYALYKQFTDGELTYSDWIHELLVHHQSLTRAEVASVFCDYELQPDAKETIASLQNYGFHIVLISGSFTGYIQHVAKTLGITDYFACSDYIFTDDNYVADITHHDDEGKAKRMFAESYCKQEAITITDCYAVGDSSNDIPLFGATKHGITFDWCKPEVKAAAWSIVTSLSDIPTKLDIL